MSGQPEVLDDAGLRRRLLQLSLKDERRLGRRLDGVRRGSAVKHAAALARIADDIATAEQRMSWRRDGVPQVSYPEALPITARTDDIAAAIRDHQVVVVAGETGSGKTTQLPKICLELGRGVRGMIGHTQPRRIAARAVAERVAEELDTPLGQAVGFRVRFTDQVSGASQVKVMTDGILLAEIAHDRDLLAYDTIILDEAHERSLNIDFLLGYLTQLLPRRPDLKLIITSATIDPERFARHFGGAPIVEVSGRGYPVEVRYRPMVDNDVDQVQAIRDAVDELCAQGPGDILVFLSGEREIRDTADALVDTGAEVVPLYARLSAAEQHRVFAPHDGRRIVLATNVAETSLTVPGIRYVVDPGSARISRYSQRTKVQRLPIEAISQASATQRAGRCGRVAAGVCIRLYEEEDLLGRPEFTDPEILRTNLASVLLQMAALGLGDVAAFPFLEPPDRRNVRDGVALLEELGALQPASGAGPARLTPLGRQLAQLPVDPRLARMVIEADRNGCLAEVLVITAALSIQDPRERPLDQQQAAADMHARFADPSSDFQTYLHLWDYLRDRQRELTSSAFRRLCRAEFLHYLRIREWQDLHAQLRQVARSLGLSTRQTGQTGGADPDRIAQSLLAGLLSHVGLREGDRRDYAGARGARFTIAPGSALASKPPRWVVVAELVETHRLRGRVAARVTPEWVESLAGHLVLRSYSEPHWSRRQAGVTAYERVTLYGVPLVTRRSVSYGSVDPELSRELFLRHALVEGDWDTHHVFLAANRALLDEVAELEDRARMRGIVVDEEVLYDFYAARVPAEVVSGRHFDSWWKQVRRTKPDLLDLTPSMLLTDRAGDISLSDYPDEWVQGDLRLPLSYAFAPGDAVDGVSVHVPVTVLNRLVPEGFDWQVPGLRLELVTALLRALPKPVRVQLGPATDTARQALAALDPPGEGSLLSALESELLRLRGVVVAHSDWASDRLPDHLRPTFVVEEASGRVLAEGKDLAGLQRQLAPRVQAAVSGAATAVERTGLTSWTVGTVPTVVREGAVQGYPALVDEGSSVALRVLPSPLEQQRSMWTGTRRLLLLSAGSPVKAVAARLSNAQKLALSRNPHGSVAAMLDDCVTCACDALMAANGGPAYDEEGFRRLASSVRASLVATTYAVMRLVEQTLAVANDVDARLTAEARSALAPAVADMRAQLDALVYPDFVTATGRERLAELPRYLSAIARRLERLPRDPVGDELRMARVHEVLRDYQRLPVGEDRRRIRWLVEELRVSLFAQQLGTRQPVSEQRIYREIDAAAG